MYYRIIKNDFLRNKAVTLTTMTFIAAAAMLFSLAAILVVNLSGAIDTLMFQAKTPHFMQMHAGELDTARLAVFAEQNPDVAEFQVLEFLNVDGAQIIFENGSLAGSVQDNGFSVQSHKFDFLLDLNGNIITASDGEVYVPICYMQNGAVKVGEKITVAGKSLTVAGFLRDSQMNSLLSSSKRFLVSQNDFSEIRNFGSMEYLIEFRLKDLSALGEFETRYTAAKLNANGPTITYPLFKMINAISDGMMIAVILLISGLVTGIAFLCIRFTLLAKIEDDYREIGVMKAIGLRVADIKKIYLINYTVLAALGSLIGFGLSFIFREPLLKNIRLYLGESQNAALSPLIGGMGVLFLCFGIAAYVNNVLHQFRKISPVEAIRFGIAQDNPEKHGGFQLSGSKVLSLNVLLGIKDVLSRKRMYATLLLVLILSAFIIILPQNLHNTIAAKEFSAYMGIGESDLRIDIQQTEQIAEKSAQITQAMAHDGDILKYTALTTHTFQTFTADHSERRITVELGDHSVFPIHYSEGHAPDSADDIALSVLNASDLGKKVGDTLTLVINGSEKDLIVCGIYSDVTNGGKTAKAVFRDDSAEVMWSVINAQLRDKSLTDKVTADYAERFQFAKVSSIQEYITQTFGGTIRSVATASWVAITIALIITALITLLFMKMLVVKDRYSIAVMKALGFTNADITAQYFSRSIFVLIIGILLGTLLANTLGELLASAVIASFGASSFEFIINPVFAYLLSPLMMACAVLAAAFFGTQGAGQVQISENIKE